MAFTSPFTTPREAIVMGKIAKREEIAMGIGSLRCFEDVHEEICEVLQKVAATAGYRRPPKG